MNSADLQSEMWASVQRVRGEHITRLLDLGCQPAALAALGSEQPPFGFGRARLIRGGFYEPDDMGDPVVIVPVFDWLGAVPGVVDLIAWQTSRPRRWAWRIGTGWALGEHLLEYGDAVRVVETPLEWLASGGRAFCPLDWDAPASCWARLRSGPKLIFADDLLKSKVRAAIARSVQMPEMEVRRAA